MSPSFGDSRPGTAFSATPNALKPKVLLEAHCNPEWFGGRQDHHYVPSDEIDAGVSVQATPNISLLRRLRVEAWLFLHIALTKDWKINADLQELVNFTEAQGEGARGVLLARAERSPGKRDRAHWKRLIYLLDAHRLGRLPSRVAIRLPAKREATASKSFDHETRQQSEAEA